MIARNLGALFIPLLGNISYLNLVTLNEMFRKPNLSLLSVDCHLLNDSHIYTFSSFVVIAKQFNLN